MATRLYFPASGSAPVTPSSWNFPNQSANATTIGGSWGRGASALATSSNMATGTTSPTHRGAIRYVYGPLADQTISGTVKGQWKCAESNNGANATLGLAIKIIQSDGTDRAVLLAYTAADTFTDNTAPEMAGSLTNRRFRDTSENTSISLTSQSATAGDYLVVEVGFRSATTVTRNITYQYGNNAASDLAEDETSTASNNPWIEFSNDIIPLGSGGSDTTKLADQTITAVLAPLIASPAPSEALDVVDDTASATREEVPQDLTASGLSNETLKLSEASGFVSLESPLRLSDQAPSARLEPLVAEPTAETTKLSDVGMGMALLLGALRVTDQDPSAERVEAGGGDLSRDVGSDTLIVADSAIEAARDIEVGASAETFRLSESAAANLDPLEATVADTLALSTSAVSATSDLEATAPADTLKLSESALAVLDPLAGQPPADTLKVSESAAGTLNPLDATLTAETLKLSESASGGIDMMTVEVAAELLHLADAIDSWAQVEADETVALSEGPVSAALEVEGTLTASGLTEETVRLSESASGFLPQLAATESEVLALSESGTAELALFVPLRITDQAPSAQRVDMGGLSPSGLSDETLKLADGSAGTLLNALEASASDTLKVSDDTASAVRQDVGDRYASPDADTLRLSDQTPEGRLSNLRLTVGDETLKPADQAPTGLLDPLRASLTAEELDLADQAVSARLPLLEASASDTLKLSDSATARLPILEASGTETLRLSEQTVEARLPLLEGTAGPETLKLSELASTASDLPAPVSGETLRLADGTVSARLPLLEASLGTDTLTLADGTIDAQLDSLVISEGETVRLATEVFAARIDGDNLAVGLTEALKLSDQVTAEKPDLNLTVSSEDLALSETASAVRLPLQAVLLSESLALGEAVRGDLAGFTLRFCLEPGTPDASPTAGCTMESLAAESTVAAETTEPAGTTPTACLSDEE